MSKSLNPLPEEEVGLDLVVRLQAERLIKKLGLREDFEGEGGWNFSELCWLIAQRLGLDLDSLAGSNCSLEKLERQHPKDFARIEKEISSWERVATPDVTGGLSGEGKCHLEIMLMMGLGTPKVNVPVTKGLSGRDTLADGACRLLGCKPSVIAPAAFNRAKTNVKTWYAAHQQRSIKRGQFRAEMASKQGNPSSQHEAPFLITELARKMAFSTPGFLPKATVDAIESMAKRNTGKKVLETLVQENHVLKREVCRLRGLLEPETSDGDRGN